MTMQLSVTIYNEAGTGIVATGFTVNNGATVTNLSAPVTVRNEYQLQVDGGQRRGVMCTAYNAGTNTANFA